jgi:uncharacterized membrane protein (UPF0127 family)
MFARTIKIHKAVLFVGGSRAKVRKWMANLNINIELDTWVQEKKKEVRRGKM